MVLPPAFAAAHPGPQFGTAGTRRLTGVAGRPVIGSIVKPALGLRPHETAAIVRELVEAEVDFIKDDEKLMSPAYSSLAERVRAVMPIVLDHEQKTGKKVMYAFNISADDPDQMMRDHDVVAEAGGNAAVISIKSVGFGGMTFLRRRSPPRPPRPPQRLGPPHPPPRASAWSSGSTSSSGGCSASTSSRSTASGRNIGSRTTASCAPSRP